MGIDDDRHGHLQTRGVLLLPGPHLDQPHKVQVRVSTLVCLVDCWLFLVDTVVGLASDEELDSRGGREQFVELDSLDTEKALLLTDDDDAL